MFDPGQAAEHHFESSFSPPPETVILEQQQRIAMALGNVYTAIGLSAAEREQATQEVVDGCGLSAREIRVMRLIVQAGAYRQQPRI